MAKRSAEIRQQLLRQIFWGIPNPVKSVAEEFNLTPQAVHLHLKDLIAQNTVETRGERRQMRYQLKVLNKHQKRFPLDGNVTEDPP